METSKKLYFKGFDKDLKCRDFQYQIGETYTQKEEPRLCSKGFHCCDSLYNVFNYYPRMNRWSIPGTPTNNRYCIVELGGTVLHDGDKSVSNVITVVKELSQEDIEFYLKKEKEEEEDKIFCVDVVEELQQKYPNVIIGGSVSLYLLGYPLEREENAVDFDIILPYFERIDSFGAFDVEEFDGKKSGNDFSITYAFAEKNGRRFLKADVRIKPDQKYEIAEYKGKKYKVCDPMATLEAKCRYAMEGNKKHREDIIHLLKNNQKTEKK